MRIKVIACTVFKDYIELLDIDKQFDVEYLEIAKHLKPEELNQLLQTKINQSKGYDSIILLYGICGNAIKGIYAAHCPIIVPRFHDCCSILLGSRKRFKEIFKEQYSKEWTCSTYYQYSNEQSFNDPFGFMNQSLQEYIEKYGEDNGQYLYNMLVKEPDKEQIYISFENDLDKKYIDEILENKDIELKIVKGNLDILKKLFQCQWENDNFLLLEKDERVIPVYDDEIVIKKGKG